MVGNKINSDKSVNIDTLRFIDVSIIDEMITQLINSNKTAFGLYFYLIKIKEVNKISVKESIIVDKAGDNEKTLNSLKDD